MLTAEKFIKEVSKIRNIVIFAGAGISKETGLPLWKEIISDLFNQYKPANVNKSDLDNPDNFPEIAQNIYDYLKKENRQKEYYEFIQGKLKPSKAQCTIIEVNIISITNWILTTNFDDTLEKAFDRRELYDRSNNKSRKEINILPYFSFNNAFLKNNVTTIDYIHGKADVNHIIFRKEDYEKYYPAVSNRKVGCTTALEDYLKHILRNYTVLFIGFSFLDHYFKEFLKIVYDDIKNQDEISSERIPFRRKLDSFKHYALILKNRKIGNDKLYKSNKIDKKLDIESFYESIDEELLNIGITTCFCEKPLDIDNILEDIMKLKKEKSFLSIKSPEEVGAYER
jgi:NAD-dependent SIR2 family protein deacetylase